MVAGVLEHIAVEAFAIVAPAAASLLAVCETGIC